MATTLLSPRPKAYQRPLPPYTLNPFSVQARGLYRWYPGLGIGSPAREVLNLAIPRSSGDPSVAPEDVLVPASTSVADDPVFGPSYNIQGTTDSLSSYTFGIGAVPVPAGSDFTFVWYGTVTAWVGSNPGMWRGSVSFSDGNFNIFQGVTGLPWIRWNSADVLKPASGVGVPLGQPCVFAFRVRSARDASFMLNGQIIHTATHATATAAFGIFGLGFQGTTSERVNGRHAEMLFYSRALSDAELYTFWAPRTRWDRYLRKKAWIPVDAAAAPTFKSAWAATSNVVLQPGVN